MVAGSDGRPALLGQRYHLIRVIGSGGMGVVWGAYDELLRRQVACKVISGPIAHDTTFQERFQREARHAASLSHPHIVTIFDSGNDDDQAYLVMEYIDGVSLRDVLNQRHTLDGPTTARIAMDVLDGLVHVHARGIVHRDIKPANLLIGRDGSLKITDFGIAKSLGSLNQLTAQGVFVGTASYAAPEQHGLGRGDPRADLYSLGCVMYQCLCGRVPEVGEAARHELEQRAPTDLVEAVMRVLATDPDDRFADAQAMQSALAHSAVEESLNHLVTGPEFMSGDDTDIGQLTRPASEDGTAFIKQHPDSRINRAVPYGLTRRYQKRTILGVGIAAVVALAALLAATLSGHTTRRPPDTIASGGFLRPGGTIESMNAVYTVEMQLDGNLVEYAAHKSDVEWESDTSGNFNAYAVMQSDGNFVVYPAGKAAPAPGHPTSALWDSGTSGHSGAAVQLLDDGALEIKSASNNKVLWRAGRP